MFTTRTLCFSACLLAFGVGHDATAQTKDPPFSTEIPASAQPTVVPVQGQPGILPPPEPVVAEPTVVTPPPTPPKPPTAPTWRLMLSNLLVLRVYPIGLEDQIRFGFQRRLPDIEGKEGPLYRDRFVFFGLAPRLNPAFIKVGPSVEVQPFSIINVRFAAEYIGFFSTFGFLQSFSSARDDYNDKLMAACASTDAMVRESCSYRDTDGMVQQGASERRNYKASGLHVMIEPVLQFKLGPVAMRNRLALEYWYMNLRDGDRVFYDVTLDTLVPARGWVLANDLDVSWVSKFGLTVGVRYSVVQPFYSGNDLFPGEYVDFVSNGIHRLGPMLSYTFYDRPFTRFNRPTLLLISGFFLSHRYRTGAAPAAIIPGVFVQNPAMPSLVLGFSFQSDLLSPTAKR